MNRGSYKHRFVKHNTCPHATGVTILFSLTYAFSKARPFGFSALHLAVTVERLGCFSLSRWRWRWRLSLYTDRRRRRCWRLAFLCFITPVNFVFDEIIPLRQHHAVIISRSVVKCEVDSPLGECRLSDRKRKK